MSNVDQVTTVWRKSKFSDTGSADDACIEIAFSGDRVALRDSKDAGGPILVVSAGSFLAAIKGR